jgi:hypothetical protein
MGEAVKRLSPTAHSTSIPKFNGRTLRACGTASFTATTRATLANCGKPRRRTCRRCCNRLRPNVQASRLSSKPAWGLGTWLPGVNTFRTLAGQLAVIEQPIITSGCAVIHSRRFLTVVLRVRGACHVVSYLFDARQFQRDGMLRGLAPFIDIRKPQWVAFQLRRVISLLPGREVFGLIDICVCRQSIS